MISSNNFWSLLSNLIWPGLVASGVYFARHEIKEVFGLLKTRLRSGAGFKIASFEIGPVAFADPRGQAGASTNDSDNFQRSLEVSIDTGARDEEREQIYDQTKRLFLVHRLTQSAEPRYQFDVTIYVISHKDGSTLGVKSVDYYFGEFWKKQIFHVANRYNGFAISTSAYGPFLCTANVTLEGGSILTLSRYIDFEMGNIAAETARPASKG